MSSSPLITSRQNPRVKDAALLRNSRERQRRGQFLIDGAREITRAVEAGVGVVQVFVCDELCKSDESRRAVKLVESTSTEVFRITSEVNEKLAFGERHDGVIVVAETMRRGLAGLQLTERPIVAVLEGIEKPGNLGAILRSADAAGVDAVIVANGRTDLFNPNTIRASLGTVFRANVCEASLAEVIEWLSKKELPIIAARPDAQKLYTEVDLRNGAAIVLGSEAEGLTDIWHAANVTAVRLPMHGIADSLNVSTTAAVLFYEALRQRS